MRWLHARIHWGETLDVVTQNLSKPAGWTHLVTWPATEFDLALSRIVADRLAQAIALQMPADSSNAVA